MSLPDHRLSEKRAEPSACRLAYYTSNLIMHFLCINRVFSHITVLVLKKIMIYSRISPLLPYDRLLLLRLPHARLCGLRPHPRAGGTVDVITKHRGINVEQPLSGILHIVLLSQVTPLPFYRPVVLAQLPHLNAQLLDGQVLHEALAVRGPVEGLGLACGALAGEVGLVHLVGGGRGEAAGADHAAAAGEA